jgi:hypothetical protein
VLFLPKGNIFYFFHLIGMTRVFFFCDILEKCHNFNNHENCWFMKSSSGNLWAMIWIRYNYNTNTHEAYNQETNTLQNVRIQYSRSVYSLSVYSLETCTLQNVYSLNNMTLFVSFLYVSLNRIRSQSRIITQLWLRLLILMYSSLQSLPNITKP